MDAVNPFGRLRERPWQVSCAPGFSGTFSPPGEAAGHEPPCLRFEAPWRACGKPRLPRVSAALRVAKPPPTISSRPGRTPVLNTLAYPMRAPSAHRLVRVRRAQVSFQRRLDLVENGFRRDHTTDIPAVIMANQGYFTTIQWRYHESVEQEIGFAVQQKPVSQLPHETSHCRRHQDGEKEGCFHVLSLTARYVCRCSVV